MKDFFYFCQKNDSVGLEPKISAWQVMLLPTDTLLQTVKEQQTKNVAVKCETCCSKDQWPQCIACFFVVHRIRSQVPVWIGERLKWKAGKFENCLILNVFWSSVNKICLQGSACCPVGWRAPQAVQEKIDNWNSKQIWKKVVVLVTKQTTTNMN